MKLKVNNKIYNVKVAETEEDQIQGLRGVDKLPNNEGMWFVFDEPQTVEFEMDGTKIDLLIVFVDENLKVISTEIGKAGDEEDYLEEDNVKYVLEVNTNNDIKEGDTIELLDSEMHILDENGKSVYKMQGGERVISRPQTKKILEMAQMADATKSDEDYLKLGKYIKKVINKQDNQEPQYVELKSE